MITKPMLAFQKNPDLDTMRYPKLLSPKLDGFRCLKVNGKALSRSFKPIPNKFTREWIEKYLPDGVDGELVIRGGTFNDCQSAFMSVAGEPDFEYHLFDFVTTTLDEPFADRLVKVCRLVSNLGLDRVKIVPHSLVQNRVEVERAESEYVAAGFEGAMLRDPLGRYKEGRSGKKEELLLKLKR